MSAKARIGLVVGLFCGVTNHAWASSIVLDQSNPFSCPNLAGGAPPNPNFCVSQNPYSRAIVQTFTPALDAADVVTVWVSDVHDDALNSGSLAKLVIRSGGNGGAIVGTALLSVSNHGVDPADVFPLTFTFGSTVGLIPGGAYSWQFTVEGGDTEGLAVFATAYDPYPGGTGFSGGSDTGGDWFFGEGVLQSDTDAAAETAPEPATLILLGSGLSLAARLRRR